MSERKRNPEKILRAVERGDRQRGQLRIFLGMCPGVGKTYSMLKAAKDQMDRGRKIMVGVVETHGREDTQKMLGELPIVPKKALVYRGTSLLEMDLDELLNHSDYLILVDELAHTNVPGSRHAKRYQDVDELLAAGLDVYTTLNIQHVESRNDQIRLITGVGVRETVPDAFLEKASQIDLIDLSPNELLKRLQEGKVYLGEAAVAAQGNFFKEEQLMALRELSLRFTAEKVDQDLNDQMIIKGIAGPWNTQERLLVAVSQSPYSARLIRATRRMAYSLEAPWIAVYVDLGVRLSKDDETFLEKNMALARRLGAEVLTVTDVDVVSSLQSICEERNVTQIVIGRPDRRFFRDWFKRGSLLEELVRTTSRIDVHVIRAERAPRYRGFHLELPKFSSGVGSYLKTAGFLGLISIMSHSLLPYVGFRALGFVYLLAILIVSSVASQGPILFAAVASSVIWDFFFIPPTLTFTISSWDDAMMVFSFLLTALVGGLLTSRIRRQESVLQSREQRTRTLYEFVQNLSNAKTLPEIAQVMNGSIARHFNTSGTIYLVDEHAKIQWEEPFGPALSELDIAVARWSYENAMVAGWSTSTLSASKIYCVPIRGKNSVVGIMAIQRFETSHSFFSKGLSVDQDAFLQSVVSQAAIAIERFLFSYAANRASLYEASEELHQTLLNSVSHELRTPITALIGTSTALKDPATFADSRAREALTDEMVRSAQRLNHVVENLLDLSRLQKVGLHLRHEWFDLADLVESSRKQLEADLLDCRLVVIKDDSVLVEGDFQLLCHAFNQLILNAAKYSPSGSSVEIELLRSAPYAILKVRDEGQGVPQELSEQIFEKFFRLPGTPAGGLGLGLAIAKSIVGLHAGTISVHNRQDKHGAEFEIKIPLKDIPSVLTKAMS